MCFDYAWRRGRGRGLTVAQAKDDVSLLRLQRYARCGKALAAAKTAETEATEDVAVQTENYLSVTSLDAGIPVDAPFTTNSFG